MATITEAPKKTVFNFSDLVSRQKLFFRSGATRKISFRINQLKKLRSAIGKYEGELIEALNKDLGRDEVSSYVLEIGFILNEIDEAIRSVRKWARPNKVSTPLFHAKAKSYIQSDPYGTALIIAPWNYPFQLLIGPLVGSMAAGNTAIIKPSEISEHTSKVIYNLITENFDEQYLSVVEGDASVAKSLLEEKFDYIFYTGSTAVGKLVYKAAAKNLTPVTLELGGKSPCIIDKKVNVELAAKRIVWGKLVNAGQTCIAPDYLLVHSEIKDRFLDECKNQIEKMYGSDPQKSIEYCRIINKRHFERLKTYLEDGKIYSGGKLNAEERYIEPTILTEVSPDSRVMNEEIFGPILPVIEFEDLSEAIGFINERPKPLALYIFSSRQRVIDNVVESTSSGGVTINDTLMHIANPHLPFGGVGDSGIGAYHGESSFETFSHQKSVLHKSFVVDPPIRYAPFSELDFKLLKGLMKFFNR